MREGNVRTSQKNRHLLTGREKLLEKGGRIQDNLVYQGRTAGLWGLEKANTATSRSKRKGVGYPGKGGRETKPREMWEKRGIVFVAERVTVSGAGLTDQRGDDEAHAQGREGEWSGLRMKRRKGKKKQQKKFWFIMYRHWEEARRGVSDNWRGRKKRKASRSTTTPTE